MNDTTFPTATVTWRALALGQDNNDGLGKPNEYPVQDVRVRLTPSPRRLEIPQSGAIPDTTYTIRVWDLYTNSSGVLVNPDDPTQPVQIIASDAIPGITIEWQAELPTVEGVAGVTKRFLALQNTTVDLTTVESVAPSPSPLADYLQAVADARAARDTAAAYALQVQSQHGDVQNWHTDTLRARDEAVRASLDVLGALPEYDEDAGEYKPDSLATWVLRQRDGRIYGVDVPKGLTTACTKTASNAGIPIPTPGTSTTPAVDPYTGKGPFFITTVNGYIDNAGVPHVTAFEGDATFSLTGDNGDVWILAPTLFWRYEEYSDYINISISDVRRPGFETQPKGILPNLSTRPYMLYAKYALSTVAGTPRSISGQPPTIRTVSHNSLMTLTKSATTGYSGKSYADDWYVKTMFLLKYATKHSQSVLSGTSTHNNQIFPLQAETDTTRVLVTTAQANTFPVGSAVMIGDQATSTTDRQQIASYNIVQSATITSKTVIDANTVALNLDTEPFTIATTYRVSTSPWHTGGCDSVVGDGSPTSPLSGREPFTVQGIELSLGMYEIISDVLLNSDGSTGWFPYTLKDTQKQATSPTADYVKGMIPIPSAASDQWNYPLYPGNHNGFLYGIESGASTTSGLADGVYSHPVTTVGTRQWLGLGYLVGGGIVGLWLLDGLNGAGGTWWSIGARLSGIGRGG